jgi:hypothetical protein
VGRKANAADEYMTDGEGADYRTTEMWANLYDAIIYADIDDVGDEYDPLLDLSEDYDVCEFCGEIHGELDDEDGFEADFDDYDSEDYEADEAAFKKWLDEAIAEETEQQKKVS